MKLVSLQTKEPHTFRIFYRLWANLNHVKLILWDDSSTYKVWNVNEHNLCGIHDMDLLCIEQKEKW